MPVAQARAREPSSYQAAAGLVQPPSSIAGPGLLKLVLARQMEVYAGFRAHTDHHIGRLLDAIDALGCSGQAHLLHHR